MHNLNGFLFYLLGKSRFISYRIDKQKSTIIGVRCSIFPVDIEAAPVPEFQYNAVTPCYCSWMLMLAKKLYAIHDHLLLNAAVLEQDAEQIFKGLLAFTYVSPDLYVDYSYQQSIQKGRCKYS